MLGQGAGFSGERGSCWVLSRTYRERASNSRQLEIQNLGLRKTKTPFSFPVKILSIMEYIIKQLLLHNWLVYVLALEQRYEGWYSKLLTVFSTLCTFKIWYRRVSLELKNVTKVQ